MNGVLKIAIAITLVFCLCVAFIACRDRLEDGYVYVTDEEGNVVTDDEGNPVTAPDKDGDGQPDESTDSDSESGTGISVGEDTDDGKWGEIIRPTNK